MAARVQEDADFRPLAISLEGRVLEVVSVDERAEEEAEWWEPEQLFRMHYQVTRRAASRLTGCWSSFLPHLPVQTDSLVSVHLVTFCLAAN